MRALNALIGAAFAALLVNSCGRDDPIAGGSPEGSSQASPRLSGELVFEREGGFAGFDDHLAISADGRLSVRTAARAEYTPTPLAPEELASLVSLVHGCAALQKGAEQATTPSAEGADFLTYRITYGNVMVTVSGETLPPELQPLVERCSELLVR